MTRWDYQSAQAFRAPQRQTESHQSPPCWQQLADSMARTDHRDLLHHTWPHPSRQTTAERPDREPSGAVHRRYESRPLPLRAPRAAAAFAWRPRSGGANLLQSIQSHAPDPRPEPVADNSAHTHPGMPATSAIQAIHRGQCFARCGICSQQQSVNIGAQARGSVKS
jgi:hypothetical protein